MIETHINRENNRIVFLGNLEEFHGTEVHKNIQKIAGIQQVEDVEDESTLEEKALKNVPQSSQS